MWTEIQTFVAEHGFLARALAIGMVAGLMFTFFRGFLRARKIQPKGFRWRTFRNEAIFGLISVPISGFAIGFLTTTLTKYGLITFNAASASWWMIGLEYALYFLAFDTWFYWNHRLMHKEPIYKWVHKLHHFSTAPNLLSTISVTPLESLINGGFVALFTAAVTVHQSTMALIVPTNIVMGFYIHSGFEFFPRWWNKSWATKWFITATFHDQHHKYFNYNYGGYTTLWDRLCGTMRPKFEADFDKLKARASEKRTPAFAAVEESGAAA